MNTVTIHGNEWKQEDIEEPVAWALSQKWVRKKWLAPSETWDHDHCAICWWKLHESDDEVHGVGFNDGGHNWLCTECYEQFIEHKI
ncbi:hypothetical protein [Alishewanella sp. HL-SH05]|uniref:hypothetical protein n=1 Tax=Alishewanella sp. HL-SH05 TaxID=3461145 RepID=UPI004042238E